LTHFVVLRLCCATAGGKNGVIAPDQTTFDYVNARTDQPYEPVYTDAAANFCADYK
jgi:3-isopropylmalate/(R)-2-methylmalate dehydratase large subunit